MYNTRTLDDAACMRLLFEACHPEVANDSRQEKIDYPAINEDAEILEPVADSETYREENCCGRVRKIRT
jgi:hypothetical protein